MHHAPNTPVEHRFSFGPWNISEGGDAFGPDARPVFPHEDQDKNFGSANLRAAFNQVRVLEEAGYGSRGEFIGLDVKAMRTQSGAPATAHLTTSREIFLHLVEKYRSLDQLILTQYRDARDYEALELHLIRHLLGV